MKVLYMLIIVLLLISFLGCAAGVQNRVGVVEYIPGEKPSWVTRLDYKDDVIEAVGYSMEMPLPEVSMQMAEEMALGEMASIMASTVMSSIRTAVSANRSLDETEFTVVFDAVRKVYSEETMEEVAIVDHYIDPQTGLTYALARVNRDNVLKDASLKAKKALGEKTSLIDQIVLDSTIKSIINSTGENPIEATGYASVSGKMNKKNMSDKLFLAMSEADLVARSALARQVRTSVINDISQWINSHKSSFGDEESVRDFYDRIVESFSDVELEGSRIVERYFSKDTKTAYSRAVIDRAWTARDFINAAVEVMKETNKQQIEDDINRVIMNNLDVLIQGSKTNKPQSQNPDKPSGDTYHQTLNGWKWWVQEQKEGDYGEYFYGIGNTENEALSRLSRYTKTRIEYKSSSKIKATREDVESKYESYTNIESKRELYGVEYKKYDNLYLAYILKKRMQNIAEVLDQFILAESAFMEDDISACIDYCLSCAEKISQIEADGFSMSLKADLEANFREAMENIQIKPKHKNAQDFGLQLHSTNGKNLKNEKIIYIFYDNNGLEISRKYNHTDTGGNSSIIWSDKNHADRLEAIPEFVFDIENSWLEYDTTKFYRNWDLKVKQDSESLTDLINYIPNLNTGDLEVEVWTDKYVYYEGEEIKIFFRANRDCYLILCNINSEGHVARIFPNIYHSSNLVKGGRTYIIPDENSGHDFEFFIEPPLGMDRVYAFAVERLFSDHEQEDLIRNFFDKLNINISGVTTKGLTEELKLMPKSIGLRPISLKFAHSWCLFTSKPRDDELIQ
ncbi:DUF4384 domain-containing protein [Candidatus Poribacteria bacterium]|nr:DUF4384 domain-containing protein [Candidatus Poribacteria bacterium]